MTNKPYILYLAELHHLHCNAQRADSIADPEAPKNAQRRIIIILGVRMRIMPRARCIHTVYTMSCKILAEHSMNI